MRILFICNKFPYPPKDGGQIAMFAMIRGMVETGCQVTVAAINTPKHHYNVTDLPSDIAQMADFRSLFVNTNLRPLQALGNLLFSRKPYTATRFENPNFAQLLREIFAEKQFDMVQLEGLYLCSYIPLIRECSKAKIAYRAHNVEFEIWKRLAHETQNPLKRFYLSNLANRVERYERSMLNLYDCIIPITQRDCNTYNACGNQKPHFVAATGIFVNDLPEMKFVENQKFTLFHIGALDWTPNQQGLLWFLKHCWKQIREKLPEIQLVVAGRNAPQWFVDALKIESVVFAGEVSSAYDFMMENTVMIVPLLAGGGMRIKILEGLAFGKPIVSTAIGAEGIHAENGRDICIANSSEEFVVQICKLAQNEQLVREISLNANKFICEEFNNVEITKNLVCFYEQQML